MTKVTYEEAEKLLLQGHRVDDFTAAEWREVIEMSLYSGIFNLDGTLYQVKQEYICPRCKVLLDNMDFENETTGKCLNCGIGFTLILGDCLDIAPHTNNQNM